MDPQISLARLDPQTPDRKFEYRTLLIGSRVARKSEHQLKRAEGGKPQHSTTITVAPVRHVEQDVPFDERVSGIDESEPHQSDLLGDRKTVLEGAADVGATPDHLGFIDIIEIIEIPVFDRIAASISVSEVETRRRIVAQGRQLAGGGIADQPCPHRMEHAPRAEVGKAQLGSSRTDGTSLEAS